jgi:hypothetical protein
MPIFFCKSCRQLFFCVACYFPSIEFKMKFLEVPCLTMERSNLWDKLSNDSSLKNYSKSEDTPWLVSIFIHFVIHSLEGFVFGDKWQCQGIKPYFLFS